MASFQQAAITLAQRSQVFATALWIEQATNLDNCWDSLTPAQKTIAQGILNDGVAIWRDLTVLIKQAMNGNWSASQPPEPAPNLALGGTQDLKKFLGNHVKKTAWEGMGTLTQNGTNPCVQWTKRPGYDWIATPPPGHWDWAHPHDVIVPGVVNGYVSGSSGTYITSLDTGQIALAALAVDPDGSAIAPRLATLQGRIKDIQDRCIAMLPGVTPYPH